MRASEAELDAAGMRESAPTWEPASRVLGGRRATIG